MGASEKGIAPPRQTYNDVTRVSTGDENSDNFNGGEKKNLEEVQVDSETSGNDQVGVSIIEAVQSIWGKRGFRIILFGLAMIMILFELDNSTVYTYSNYATSNFSKLSALGTLNTATTIIFAVVKPPIAKLSNVIGRGQTFCGTICCYLLAYILMASSKAFGSYAAGLVFYNIGQSGTNVMTNVLISDITTPRRRGFALGLAYFPFLITPWVSAIIVGKVVGDGGIGWRWGIGMFAILMPFGSSFIIGALLFYQRKAKKMGVLKPQRITVYSFCSQIDLGGIILFVIGFACFLLPITIAASEPQGWKTPWIIVLIIVGALVLVGLVFYENLFAVHPITPIFYFKNTTIVLSCLLIATDSAGFSATHTYLYAWGVVAHNMTATVASFYVYVNGVMQCFVGIFAGWVMWYTGRYKWLVMAGCVFRLIGYGIMIRLRGQYNTLGELIVQQLIQGTGSGIIQTCLLIPPQTMVPHAQVAQVLALVFSLSYLGSSIGSTIAGAIYTNTMRKSLIKALGADATSALVDSLYNSITGELPLWESADRIAINYAYSDVIRYITYAALGVAVPPIIMCFFLPNLDLPADITNPFAQSDVEQGERGTASARDSSPTLPEKSVDYESKEV